LIRQGEMDFSVSHTFSENLGSDLRPPEPGSVNGGNPRLDEVQPRINTPSSGGESITGSTRGTKRSEKPARSLCFDRLSKPRYSGRSTQTVAGESIDLILLECGRRKQNIHFL
jgi:hypothetical protein